MHTLPPNLGRLAEHADRRDTTRFALTAVHLRFGPGNTFDAVSTDSTVLARVCGPCPASGKPVQHPEFVTSPDDRASALVPAAEWKRVFAEARKLAGRGPTAEPVGVRIGEDVTTFGANGLLQWCDRAWNLIGNFPPFEAIINDCRSARSRVRLDHRLLLDLVRTAADFATDDPGHGGLVLDTDGPNRPVVLRSGPPGGVQFTGLLMPLHDPSPPPDAATAAHRPSAELVRAYLELVAERDALLRKLADLESVTVPDPS